MPMITFPCRRGVRLLEGHVARRSLSPAGVWHTLQPVANRNGSLCTPSFGREFEACCVNPCGFLHLYLHVAKHHVPYSRHAFLPPRVIRMTAIATRSSTITKTAIRITSFSHTLNNSGRLLLRRRRGLEAARTWVGVDAGGASAGQRSALPEPGKLDERWGRGFSDFGPATLGNRFAGHDVGRTCEEKRPRDKRPWDGGAALLAAVQATSSKTDGVTERTHMDCNYNNEWPHIFWAAASPGTVAQKGSLVSFFREHAGSGEKTRLPPWPRHAATKTEVSSKDGMSRSSAGGGYPPDPRERTSDHLGAGCGIRAAR